MNKVFLFDLDSTVTKEEILPTIAQRINKGEEMRVLTESVMIGEVPFEESFRARVRILQNIPVSKVAEGIKNITLSKKVVKFIKENKDNCYIVTSNLDVWIIELIKKIGLEGHLFCSNATVKDDKIVGIKKILGKEEPIKLFKNKIVVAVGDGSNDYLLLKNADIGISYGGVRTIAPCLYDVCDYAICDEDRLYKVLNLIKEEND